jgi:hypothetical protein
MGALQDLFRTHGPDYQRRFGSRMPSEHNKVIEAIMGCPTADSDAQLVCL